MWMQENPLRYIRNKIAQKMIPAEVTLEVTGRCNLRCVHCYIPGKEKVPGEELSFAQLKSIFSQLAESGTLYLGLTGGEPFLRNDILDIAEFAKSLYFKIAFPSYLTLLREVRNQADFEPLSQC